MSHYSPTFIPAELKCNSSWYIEYYYKSSDGNLVRVRNNLNRVLKRFKKVSEKKAYALNEVANLNAKLRDGWTPVLDKVLATNTYAATPWKDVCDHYKKYLVSQDAPYKISHATVLTYQSTFSIFCNFITTLPTFTYIYMLSEEVARKFLDWSMAVRHVSETTRDNYRRWLHSFCSWLVECGYLKENPVEKIKPLGGGHHKKQKDLDTLRSKYIQEKDRKKMFEWMDKNDPWLKLAVFLCHYCFLRTKEVAQMKIEYIHLHDSLIFVPASISKNKSDAYITLTDEVARLMIDLHLFDYPGHYYIFDRQLKPAEREKPTRGDEIRERWRAMCNALGYGKDVWYYHMKHTGITDMAANISPRQVQLQARHHSIEMTERYMQPKAPEANKDIKKFK